MFNVGDRVKTKFYPHYEGRVGATSVTINHSTGLLEGIIFVEWIFSNTNTNNWYFEKYFEKVEGQDEADLDKFVVD